MKNLLSTILVAVALAFGFSNAAHAQFVMGNYDTTNGGFKTSSPNSTIGYNAGAGASVTQATNRTTGVTINTPTGQITTATTSLAAGASATFTVTSSLIKINDVVVVTQQSGATNVNTIVQVTAVTTGTFNITVFNGNATTAEVGAIILNYAILHGSPN